jgi:ubiquinone/menaquinone biosynthesis C-methylase UbiE
MQFHPLEVLKALGIKEKDRVADFGAGTGHFTFAAAQIVGEKGLVYAIEMQESLVTAITHEAQSHSLHNVHAVHADASVVGATKIPPHVLDVVLLINNHVSKKIQHDMLKEAVRITKSMGEIVVIDWLGGATVPFAPAITDRVSKADTIQNAQHEGLYVVDEFRPGRYHYGLRFRKR